MTEPLAPEQLRSVVERIETVESEIKDLQDAKKEIYEEAGGNGLDKKIIRNVVRLRKMDKALREEMDTLTEIYMDAVEGGR